MATSSAPITCSLSKAAAAGSAVNPPEADAWHAVSVAAESAAMTCPCAEEWVSESVLIAAGLKSFWATAARALTAATRVSASLSSVSASTCQNKLCPSRSWSCVKAHRSWDCFMSTNWLDYRKEAGSMIMACELIPDMSCAAIEVTAELRYSAPCCGSLVIS